MNKDYNIIIKVTTSCPGKCKCCIHRQQNFKYKNRSNSQFDLKLFDKICKNLDKLGGKYICLSGGEPTMVNNLEDYIKVAKNYKLATRINTNGWGITKEKVEKWLQLGLDQIVLSVYGTDEEIVTLLRGNRLIFEKSQKALSVLKEIKKSANFIFIIQTIISKYNYKNLPKILEKTIDVNADLFWPSYLEDAKFLPDIRMENINIKEFKNKIIPEMMDVVDKKIKSLPHRKKIKETLKQYYAKKYQDYRYHKRGFKCSLLGRHLTLYPSGVVDPCPGHEYFASEYQKIINEANLDEFMSSDNIDSNSKLAFDYCQYCPQGEHIGINLKGTEFDEHSKKEILK